MLGPPETIRIAVGGAQAPLFPFYGEITSRMLVNVKQPSLQKKGALLCNVCLFPWCKYSHCDQIQATNVLSLTVELGRRVPPNITGLQHVVGVT